MDHVAQNRSSRWDKLICVPEVGASPTLHLHPVDDIPPFCLAVYI